MCSVAKAKRETYEKYFYEVELTNEKTSVNWHPRIRHCARKQWKCCCLAASFRLKQTWKKISFYFVPRKMLVSCSFFLLFRCFILFVNPAKKCCVQAFVWLMRWFQTCTVWVSFAPWKNSRNKKKAFWQKQLKEVCKKKFDVDQNVIIVKIEMT